MEELIAIVRELVYAVHSGVKRQEVLDALDNLLKEVTTVAQIDTSTGKRKAVSSSGDS